MGTIWWPALCGNSSLYSAFWSDQLTLNTSVPDITICIQNTALTWVPCLLFLLMVPFYISYMLSSQVRRKWRQISLLNIFKTGLAILLAVLVLLDYIFLLADGEIDGSELSAARHLSMLLKIICLIIAAFVTTWGFMRGEHSSGVLFLFWFFLTLGEALSFASNMKRWSENNFHVEEYFATHTLYFVFLVLEFGLQWRADIPSAIKYNKMSEYDEKKPIISGDDNLNMEEIVKLNVMPDIRCPYWMKITYLWFTTTIIRGYKKPVKFENLYDLSHDNTCYSLVPRYLKYYQKSPKELKEIPRRTNKGQVHNSIYWTLWGSVGYLQVIATILRLISVPIQFINPQLLDLLISYIDSGDSKLWKGVALSVLMLLASSLHSLFANGRIFYSFLCGARARTVVNAAVYRKALRLSSSSRRMTTVGQIVNLLSVDAQKIQDFFLYMNLVWSVPFQIGLCILFMWGQVGPSCLAGLVVLGFLIPFNALYLGRKAMKLQISQMKQKDCRFKLLNEILAGIKILKLYAWEPSFERQLLHHREKELQNIKLVNYINAFGSLCWLLAPYLVSLAVFATFVLSSPNNILDANKAFVTLSLINILNWPMSNMPYAVTNTIQGIVSMRRINRFLQMDELDENWVDEIFGLQARAIHIEDGTFSWEADNRPVLNDINIEFPKGSLTAIVGQVGSGKSSLISSVLGELNRVKGVVRVSGTIAYVPQQAWIQNLTVRQNILFGKTCYKEMYSKVLDACALSADLKMLPAGELTEIGEKGINLSGGQKLRVSIARAVYQDKDIYLLDDPLSAVDAHVGKHIFENVIGPEGLLKRKTRILVTHSLTYLPQVDRIIVLKNGSVVESGSYTELLNNKGDFAELISQHYHANDQAPDDAEAFQIAGKSGNESESGIESDSMCEFFSNRRRSERGSLANSVAKELERLKKKSTVAQARLIEEETSEEGNIRMEVMKSYVKAGGYHLLAMVGLGHVAFIVFQILTNMWLSAWSEDDPPYSNGTYDRSQVDYRLGVYGALGAGQFLSVLGEVFAVAYGCYCASRSLHHNLIAAIIRAPMSFFDTTPIGRIMNRFSRDLDVLDMNMPTHLRQWLLAVAPIFTTMILICYSTPTFIVIMLPLAVLFVLCQRLYIKTARQLKRIESVRRSPIYMHLDESVVGASSIRAYKREHAFIDRMDRLIDDSQKPWYLIISAMRWLSVTMEFLGALVVFFASLFATLARDSLTAGLAGLSVSYSQQITISLNAFIRTSSELENYVVSVERIDEYTHVEPEAAWKNYNLDYPRNWPKKGNIKFADYATRYRHGLDLVLREIKCNIKSGEKVGIVGRTGAGKSSLSLALFRIIEAAKGSIFIDDIDISKMGLHDLRSQISIIPQDPVVFSGTLRENLDPFDRHSEDEVWRSLDHAHLKEFVGGLPEGLDYQCGEGGEALSVGQRQLLCLARALLRNSKILVLDEATAAVDMETDALIQNTIRTQFNECTIITVAHRLNTVLDYDRIMVLDKGQIREFDTPQTLLGSEDSMLFSMARDAGLM